MLIATLRSTRRSRARALFAELSHAKMDAEPQFAVRVFANIHQPERRRTSSFHKDAAAYAHARSSRERMDGQAPLRDSARPSSS